MPNRNFNLTIANELPKEHGNLDELEKFRFANDYTFPDSYKEFVKKFGYGVTLGEFIIYIPMGNYGDSVFVRAEEIKGTYIERLDSGDMALWEMEPDGTVEILKRLYPFASSENGIYLFWDINSLNNGEFDIFMTDFRGIGFKKIAKNLYDFFEAIAKGYKVREGLPFVIWPSKNTFKILNKKITERRLGF